jgi:putative ABC transport system substrate-binding protein
MSFAATATFVRAQAPGGKRRIAVLIQFARPEPGTNPRWDGLVQGLRDLGYVEGQNIDFAYAYTEGDSDRRLREATRLVATMPDIIVAGSGSDALALQTVTSTIPIVVIAGGDLARTGVVASLARPGGNVTGVQIFQPDLGGKRLELLKAVAPRTTRVGVLHERLSGEALRAYYASLVADLEVAASGLRIQVKAIAVDGADGIDRAAEWVREEGVNALLFAASPFMYQHRKRLAELAARHRLPAIYETADYVQTGGLMSYGPNITALYGHAAGYVDRILKGAKPADLPVEQPGKFELAINMKTAKQLGLTVPQSLLLRADHVIQ